MAYLKLILNHFGLALVSDPSTGTAEHPKVIGDASAAEWSHVAQQITQAFNVPPPQLGRR